jgi:hypothetical protein
LASNLDPLGLCLLSNWDYRCELLCPALEDFTNTHFSSFITELLTQTSIATYRRRAKIVVYRNRAEDKAMIP